jgi:hypothetical protein
MISKDPFPLSPTAILGAGVAPSDLSQFNRPLANVEQCGRFCQRLPANWRKVSPSALRHIGGALQWRKAALNPPDAWDETGPR